LIEYDVGRVGRILRTTCPAAARLVRHLAMILGLLMLILHPAGAAPIPPVPVPWNAAVQGAFVTCLAADREGQIWVGTEDQGVWRYDATAAVDRAWTHFTTDNGLGDDNAYAIAVDSLDRVWVGTLNHGVSVYNGREWRSYGIQEGLLGSRVFAIGVCPTDGDIWTATDSGLTRYSLKKGTWSYYTRLNGLPCDQANALAFDRKGNLFVGTQSDGIAVGSAASGYRTWSVTRGPDRPPPKAGGAGLPTSLINTPLAALSPAFPSRAS